jgi:hypothetical protein
MGQPRERDLPQLRLWCQLCYDPLCGADGQRQVLGFNSSLLLQKHSEGGQFATWCPVGFACGSRCGGRDSVSAHETVLLT